VSWKVNLVAFLDMTQYQVQYTLPVDNPTINVSMKRAKGSYTFSVPLNHPDAHKMGFMDLLAAAELSGLVTVSTDLNTDSSPQKSGISLKASSVDKARAATALEQRLVKVLPPPLGSDKHRS